MPLFHQLFDATAERSGGRVAMRYRGMDSSYAQVLARSTSLARGLAAAGLRRGDRVVVHMQNRPEVVEIALACSRLGAIFVPCSSMLKSRQLNYILADCGARALFCSESALTIAADYRAAHPEVAAFVVEDEAGTPPSDSRARAYEQLIADAQPGACPVAVIDGDPAAILYTSGSTGRPKGVVVSHRNLVAGAHCVASYLHNEPSDRLLAALPLSFDYGFSQVSTAFAVGACAVLTNFSTAPALIQEIASERITGLAGVPTMWINLAASEWPEKAAGTLRYITNSGGVFPRATIRKLRERLPRTQIFCMYGLTEAFRSTYLDPSELERRIGSIGKAIPDQEILVLRPDGTRCEPGEVGELVHRGSLVSLGYWNDSELTRQRFRPIANALEGLKREEIAVWSGDRARVDEEGFLYFEGRADDLIKSSGHRISPSDVEEIIAEVAGVREVVAVGIPDELVGQRVVGAVVVEATAPADLFERIRRHCRMQMPSFMVPAEIRCVEAIPRTVNGKSDRSALKQLLLETGASAGAACKR